MDYDPNLILDIDDQMNIKVDQYLAIIEEIATIQAEKSKLFEEIAEEALSVVLPKLTDKTPEQRAEIIIAFFQMRKIKFNKFRIKVDSNNKICDITKTVIHNKYSSLFWEQNSKAMIAETKMNEWKLEVSNYEFDKKFDEEFKKENKKQEEEKKKSIFFI